MSKVKLLISVASVIIFLVTSQNIKVHGAAGFSFTIQDYVQSVPDSESRITIDGSAKTYFSNFENPLYLSWSESVNLRVVLKNSSGDEYFVTPTTTATNILVNQAALNSAEPVTAGSAVALPQGEYYIFLRTETGSSYDSSSGVLIYDKTPPAVPTSLAVKDVNDNVITNQVSNLRNIKLTWSEPSDASPLKYEISYRVGTSTTPILFTTTGEGITSQLVSLPTDVSDGLITFEIRSIDKAKNKSTSFASVSYTLNTVAPNAVSNLTVRNSFDEELLTAGGDFASVRFTPSSSGDVAYYSVLLKIGSGPTTEIASGLGTVESSFRTIDLPSLTYNNPSLIFSVVAVDNAGNSSNGVSKALTYDATPPSFTITKGVNTNVSGLTVIASEMPSLFVTNSLSDITSYSIRKGSEPIVFKSGNASDMTSDLRALTSNGSYVVIARDIALNRAEVQFTLSIEPPTLPGGLGNRITLLSDPKDTLLTAGISKTGIQIRFTAANGATSYELYLNGQQTPSSTTIDGTTATMTFELRTISFGDQFYSLTIRALDNDGNFATYEPLNVSFRDLAQPLGIIHSTSSRSDSITFDLEVLDYMNIISQGTLEAWLYLDGQFVKKIPVNVGRATYTFDQLRVRESRYSISVVASYTLDGPPAIRDAVINRPTTYLLDTLSSGEDIVASINNIEVRATSISFNVNATKATSANRSYSVVVFSGLASGVGALQGTPLFSQTVQIDGGSLTQNKPITIPGLKAGENYHVQIKDGSLIIATTSFFTRREVPESTFVIGSSILENSVAVTVNIIDFDAAITRSEGKAVVRVFDDRGLQVTTNDLILPNIGLNSLDIAGLLPNQDYTVNIYTDYQGFIQYPNGVIESVSVQNAMIGSYSIRTAKRLPEALFSSVVPSGNDVRFSINIEDLDASLISSEVVLYENGVPIGNPIPVNRGRFNLSFDNLKTNTEYVLSLHVTYDLNDGNGAISKFGFLAPSVLTNTFKIERITTEKGEPSFVLVEDSVVRTDSSLTLTLQPNDPDNTFISGRVKIFSLTQNAPLSQQFNILRSENQTFTFTNLNPDTLYRIVVDATINVSDGNLQRSQNIFEERLRTRLPISAQVVSLNRTTTSATVVIEMYDYTTSEVSARLFQGTTPVGSVTRLSNGNTTLNFTQLLPNNEYRLVVDYGASRTELISQTFRTSLPITKTTPIISIVNATVNDDLADIRISMTDLDSAITESVDLVVCSIENECITVKTTVNALLEGELIELPFEEQTITLVFAYNDNFETKLINLQTSILTSSDAIRPEPEPDPEPEPVQPVEPAPTPREPIDLNLGVILGSVLGAVALGFTGVFFYSFRRFYVR